MQEKKNATNKNECDMKKLLLLALGLCFGVMSLYAQRMETKERVNDAGYRFWIYTPDTNNHQAKKPLVVFLHGQSLCGQNMNNLLKYGTLDALRRGRYIDAYVLAPLNPRGRWVPSKVIDLVDWAIANCPIDSCRVYVMGMSLGGFGTINVAAAYPDRIAAAMALCGGGNNPNYANLCEVPLWILHGTADKDVKIRDSDEIERGVKNECGGSRLRYDRLKGKNHSVLARIFYMPQTYDWLFSHSLKDDGRKVSKEYSIGLSDFNTAYKGLSPPSWNNIKLVSQLPAGTDNYTVESKAKYHKVKRGDTLSAIAKRNHTTVKKLCHLNGIKESSILRIGQKIKVR